MYQMLIPEPRPLVGRFHHKEVHYGFIMRIFELQQQYGHEEKADQADYQEVIWQEVIRFDER